MFRSPLLFPPWWWKKLELQNIWGLGSSGALHYSAGNNGSNFPFSDISWVLSDARDMPSAREQSWSQDVVSNLWALRELILPLTFDFKKLETDDTKCLPVFHLPSTVNIFFLSLCLYHSICTYTFIFLNYEKLQTLWHITPKYFYMDLLWTKFNPLAHSPKMGWSWFSKLPVCCLLV